MNPLLHRLLTCHCVCLQVGDEGCRAHARLAKPRIGIVRFGKGVYIVKREEGVWRSTFEQATYKLTIRDETGVTLACLSDVARRCVRASMHGFVARLAEVACTEFSVHLHEVALSMPALLRHVFERLVFL